MKFRPMLAATGSADLETVPLPKYGSPKCDGIRATVRDGVVWSRSGIELPSPDVQRLFGREEFEGLDGELILGEPNKADTFVKTESLVMTPSRNSASKNLKFYVFDKVTDGPFKDRLAQAEEQVLAAGCKQVVLLPQQLLETREELVAMEETVVALGFEGLMLRSPNGPYKQGRSTHAEGYLLRVKRYLDSDAYVVRVKPMNTSTLTNGRTAGTLLCRDMNTKVEFDMAVPRDHDIWWHNRKHINELGQDEKFAIIVKYSFSPSVGTLNKPRNPTLIGARDRRDL